MQKKKGHAKDYVKCNENYATKKPDDYILATGSTYTVKQFIEEVLEF